MFTESNKSGDPARSERCTMPLRAGVIADDFTGATDIAGALVDGGLRTVQFSGAAHVPDHVDADAVVISLKTRSIPPGDAAGARVHRRAEEALVPEDRQARARSSA